MKSAPSSRGRWLNGEAKVLSTESSASASCARLANFGISLIRISGLVGVSRWMSFVSSRIALATSDGSRVSRNVNLRPSRLMILVKSLVVPPYVFSSLITWSPTESLFTIASIAARPEEKAIPEDPFSKTAILASSASRVGLAVRP